MTEIQPFRAFRYDLGRVGSLASVIAPPYDVIDDALLARLKQQHANNIVHVDMPRPEPGDLDADACYSRAGRQLKDWIRDGIVKQDSARGIYVYHQQFTVDGQAHVRRGWVARVRLGGSNIRPHEETFAGPKLDRLKLLAATSMNLSPVFGMYPDESNEVQNRLDQAVGRQPPSEAADHLGVVGRLWPVADQKVIADVMGLMAPKLILIADGHHRYETCVQHRDRVLGEAAKHPADEPVRFALMAFVGMNDPGLVVLPTHRLVNGVRFDVAALAIHFDVTAAPDAESAWEQLQLEAGQGGLAFGTADNKWYVARPRDLSAMRELAADHSEQWRHLSVSVLHRLVLGRLLTGEAKCEYVHQTSEVSEALNVGRCELGVLVPAVPVKEVAAIAANGEKMPQKSTYFYPKLQTGFVLNPLFTN